MKRILTVKNVSKKYGELYALKNISFSLEEGEVIGLVGPNGAGKTTIMRIIVGLTKKYEGELEMSSYLNIGSIIESPSFYPFMSGYDNLKYIATLNDVDVEKVRETIDLLGLSAAINKKVKGYSLGMRQRLGIAAALLRDPKLLILDEPTNGLDPAGIRELREYVRKIADEKNITVLISSHILSELEKVCDKAIIIQHGQVIDVLDLNKHNISNEILINIETEEVDKAEYIFNKSGIKVVKRGKDSICIRVTKDKSKKVVSFLNMNNISFTGLYEEKENLEETFLNLIEENKIV